MSETLRSCQRKAATPSRLYNVIEYKQQSHTWRGAYLAYIIFHSSSSNNYRNYLKHNIIGVFLFACTLGSLAKIMTILCGRKCVHGTWWASEWCTINILWWICDWGEAKCVISENRAVTEKRLKNEIRVTVCCNILQYETKTTILIMSCALGGRYVSLIERKL